MVLDLEVIEAFNTVIPIHVETSIHATQPQGHAHQPVRTAALEAAAEKFFLKT